MKTREYHPTFMFRRKSYYIVNMVFIIFIYACNDANDETAFDRVVSYYETKGDTLKAKAVNYLRQYVIYHKGVERRLVDKEGKTTYSGYPAIFQLNSDSMVAPADSDRFQKSLIDRLGYHIVTDSSKSDLFTITDDFLYENIELAFDSWQQPWAHDVSFPDFCKYILPYRNGDEQLNDWRRRFKERYEATIADSVSNSCNLREVAEYILRCLRREVAYGPRTGALTEELLTPSEMESLHWLGCRACAHYTTLALRACGVPCAIIEMHWRFTEVVHFSVLVPAVGSNRQAFRITIGDETMDMGLPKDTMATWRTWMYTYAPSEDLLDLHSEGHRKGSRLIERLAWPVCREDVTSQLCTTFDFSLPVPDSLRSERYLYLCRFYRWQWLPVREGIVRGDSVYFKDATIRQLYRLATISCNRVVPIGGLFTLVGDSTLTDVRQRIRFYDYSGDTVLFKRVYLCEPDEQHLSRNITTYYWDSHNHWHPLTHQASLWGFNERTGEYRLFSESLRRRGFIPVFHLMELCMPRWTVFTDDETPRTIGFIAADPISGEGYTMEF